MALLYRFLVNSVIVTMVALLLLVGHRSFQSLKAAEEVDYSHEQIQTRVESLKIKIAGMEQEIERLKSDPSYYEQLAREEFGMIKENERVYLVPLP